MFLCFVAASILQELDLVHVRATNEENTAHSRSLCLLLKWTLQNFTIILDKGNMVDSLGFPGYQFIIKARSWIFQQLTRLLNRRKELEKGNIHSYIPSSHDDSSDRWLLTGGIELKTLDNLITLMIASHDISIYTYGKISVQWLLRFKYVW